MKDRRREIFVKDRRSYIRMSVDIPATAYCPDMEEEYRCTIQNISETGVGLVFSKINPVSLKPDDVIMLQFCDRFMYGGREECPVLTVNYSATELPSIRAKAPHLLPSTRLTHDCNHEA